MEFTMEWPYLSTFRKKNTYTYNSGIT